jgi:hypothetical protein
MMNVNWCASCLPSPLDDALDTTTNNADVVVPAEKGSSSSKVIDAPGASESIPTLPIKRSKYAAIALRPTAVAEARDDEVHASSSSVHAAEDNSVREDADVNGTDFLVRPLRPALTEEESSLPHSDSIKSIVSAIAADINGLFECKSGSNGEAAGAMNDASKSTTTVEEPTTETKSVSSSSSTHRSKLSSKLLSISASMLRNQLTNTNDSPQASSPPLPPPPPPPPPLHVPKEESNNLHLLVSKLWTAEQTVDATNMAAKQDTTEDNGQCDDSSVSKSRIEMMKATNDNKAVTKVKDAKSKKSFVVTRASFANAFNAKMQKKKDAKKNGEKGANAVEGSNASNVVKQRPSFVGRMKHKSETKMKQKSVTKKVSKTTTTTANTAAPQSSLTKEPVGVAVPTPFSTTIATAAGMLSRLSYDYYQVVIAGQNSKSDMMVRVPYSQQTTFADVRRELEEDYHDELPKPEYKFCITPDFTIGVSKAQESKWRVRDYDLTTQGGDGTYKMPYFVYITMDMGKKEESKVDMKKKRRALWSKK